MIRDPQREDRRQSGFTLVELLVGMALFGVLAGISTLGLSAVAKSLDARGASRESVSALRTVQGRAVAEDVAYCVTFGAGATPTNWTVYRVPGADQGALSAGFTCTSGTAIDTYKAPGGSTFSSIGFAQRNSTTTAYVLFYARGAASGGSFKVGGGGGSTYAITVDALTGRVSSSGA
ncbi:MAG: prepilin-type N-terminal cleavage/methylation domain-containing protein [Pseudorhodobacter sp.]|nr:prepilin-type N-terminal cleavage/methylation domain-containing protein [Frankiaceae bacterium]